MGVRFNQSRHQSTTTTIDHGGSPRSADVRSHLLDQVAFNKNIDTGREIVAVSIPDVDVGEENLCRGVFLADDVPAINTTASTDTTRYRMAWYLLVKRPGRDGDSGADLER